MTAGQPHPTGLSPNFRKVTRASRGAGRPGRAVLLLGIMAVYVDACPRAGPVLAVTAGRAVEVRLESLEGQAFRLLPGVGPVLAGRLEAARVAAGGVLGVEAADAVSGVGPTLLEHWARMRSRP